MAKETRKAGKKNRQAAANGPLEANGEAFVVRALAKGLAMLSLFDAEHREWTLDEMVTELKLPRMTGYRMARTLQSAGYLVTDPQSGRYRLGPALIASTYLSEGYAELVGIARPYLESLVEETGESATLAVDVDGVAVCVDMVDSPRPHKREVAVGRVIGDTANAHGKMYAASMPASIASACSLRRTNVSRRRRSLSPRSSPPSSSACATRAWPSTSRSETSARAPWRRRSGIRWAPSSAASVSSCPLAGSARTSGRYASRRSRPRPPRCPASRVRQGRAAGLLTSGSARRPPFPRRRPRRVFVAIGSHT